MRHGLAQQLLTRALSRAPVPRNAPWRRRALRGFSFATGWAACEDASPKASEDRADDAKRDSSRGLNTDGVRSADTDPDLQAAGDSEDEDEQPMVWALPIRRAHNARIIGHPTGSLNKRETGGLRERFAMAP